VDLNAARALGRVEQKAEQAHRFLELPADDAAVIERTPRVAGAGTPTPTTGDPEAPRSSQGSGPAAGDAVKMSFNPVQDRALVAKLLGDRVGGQRDVVLSPASTNPDPVNRAPAASHSQIMGATALGFASHTVVVAGTVTPSAPAFPWTLRPHGGPTAPGGWTAWRPPSLPPADLRGFSAWPPDTGRSEQRTESPAASAPTVKAVFVALGRSSGPAFRMTFVHDRPEPISLVDPGFVLEPVRGITAAEAERGLGRIPGRRFTAAIDAYCLQFLEPPPAAGVVYRIAASQVQERHQYLARIMQASKLLQVQRALHPDSDPIEYFHSVRQWAVWAYERDFKDETAFRRAVVEHAKKNLAAARRPWTRELEAAIDRAVPNRWRDVAQILALAAK